MSNVLLELQENINTRGKGDDPNSYTRQLFQAGVNKCAQKLGEEAVETVIAATNGTDEEVVSESADLLYHLMVTLARRDLSIKHVIVALQQRMGQSGIEEKLSRRQD